MRQFHLEKNDSADIGFATTCLVAGVISFAEFKEWLYFVIEHQTVVPSYIFDILDLNEKFEYTLKAVDHVGFNPAWDASEVELLALDGIAFLRSSNHQTDATLRDVAIAALAENPQVEERFRQTFPFIEF